MLKSDSKNPAKYRIFFKIAALIFTYFMIDADKLLNTILDAVPIRQAI